LFEGGVFLALEKYREGRVVSFTNARHALGRFDHVLAHVAGAVAEDFVID
jgi:hypothetical protein